MENIILYGAGNRCRTLCRIVRQTNIRIIAVLDGDPAKWGKQIEGCRVEKPEKLRGFRDKYVCITVTDTAAAQEIREKLRREYRHDQGKEVSYHRLILEAYRRYRWDGEFVKARQTCPGGKENLLFDCYNGLGLGGVEAWTMDLCGALIRDGRENVYIISDEGDYSVPAILNGHIVYAYIDHREPFSPDSLKSLMGIMLKKLPCKVVTCNVNEVMLAAYLVKRCYPGQVEILSVIHNSNEAVYERYMDFMGCPNLYIGVSQDIRRDMIQRGVKEDAVFSVTCPFECEPLLVRGYSKERIMPLRLGYAGRIEYDQKRMDLILELIRLLIEKKVRFEMEFAGDGAARGDMEKYVRGAHWEDKVRFLGRIGRARIPSFWKRQDICVNLADYEGRSISILEAMGNGAVPVVTMTSGVREDITDGENGYIVPLGDYRAAADRIAYLDRHRERLAIMGAMAHGAVYPKSKMGPHLKFWENILFGEADRR